MLMRISVVGWILILLTGCHGLRIAPVIDLRSEMPCLHPDGLEDKRYECDIDPWIGYWLSVASMDWKKRKHMIQSLGNSDVASMKKVLLSQGSFTPYQDRLRAQFWAESLIENYSLSLGPFLKHIIYLPAQEKLELESALSSLTRINSRQLLKMEHLQQQVTHQTQQLKELLHIETQMLNKRKAER